MIQTKLGLGIGLAIGILLLVLYFQEIQRGSELRNQADVAKTKLNEATNDLVNTCLNTLPTGSSDCDDLRARVADGCATAKGSLDVCNDDRVNQYYKGISANSTFYDSGSISSSQTQAAPIFQPATDTFDYQAIITMQMGTTNLEILNQSELGNGKISSDIKVGNTIYSNVISPMPTPDLTSRQLILTTENYGPVYDNYQTVHNLAMWCFSDAYPEVDWMHYTGWKPDLSGNACHSVGFDTGALCTDHYQGAVPVDYYYIGPHNREWICSDSVINAFSSYNGPVESTVPKVKVDNSLGISAGIGKFAGMYDSQWSLYLELDSVNYGPDGTVQVRIFDYISNDLILEKEFSVRLNETIAYNTAHGGSYSWLFPLGISQSDTKTGQIVMQLDYTTVKYDKDLMFTIGCDLSNKYDTACTV